jgi:CO/xanthine dehydrogenase FAD-binding subunit
LIGNLFPAFADYVEGLGNIRIRMQGTIGGNILADQPLYEVRPLLFVTDAMLEFVDVEGRRIQVTPDAVMRAKLPRTLLSAIIVPLKPVHLAWARELRPHLSVVVAHAASQDDRVAVVGAPSGFAGLRVPREGASAAIDRWFATVEFSSTEDEAIYLRRAARVLLQRCLARAAREP